MTWEEIIKKESEKDYAKSLERNLEYLRKTSIVYPDKKDTFRAFSITRFEDIKVVIVGQDPYHDGNADGLAFSCKEKLSPSLKAILDSLKLEVPKKHTVTLENWAKQGILLLNRSLTVEKGFANSHCNFGWFLFTGEILRTLVNNNSPKVFLLWGNEAQKAFPEGATNYQHLVLKCEHPVIASYRKRAWNNEDCFIKTNVFFRERGIKAIDWKEITISPVNRRTA